MRDPQWLKRRRRAQKSACSSGFMITQGDAWKSLHRGPMEPGILKLLAQLSPDSSMNSLTVAFSMSTTGRIKGVAEFDFLGR